MNINIVTCNITSSKINFLFKTAEFHGKIQAVVHRMNSSRPLARMEHSVLRNDLKLGDGAKLSREGQGNRKGRALAQLTL